MGHFGQSKPSTCTCYLPLPPSLVLPRPCRWCTTPPSTSPQTRCWSAFPARLAREALKAPSDLSDKVTLQQTRRPPRTPHMALHRSDVSRSRPIVVLPRAIMTLRPGDTTTPSQQTSRFTIRVCTKPNQTHNHSSILQLLNLYLQTKRLELLSKWFCYKNTPVSVINKHKSLEKKKKKKKKK